MRFTQIVILLLALVIPSATLAQRARNAQQHSAPLPRTYSHSIKGIVVEIMHPRAGASVQLKSGGKLYQFGLGTENGRLTDQRIKAWEGALNMLKPGDAIIIEYSGPLAEYPGIIYGEALRVQVDRPPIMPRGPSPQRIDLPSFIRPQHRAILQEWLSNKSGWRPATIDDALAGETKVGREFLMGEIQSNGGNYQPYYAVADFNRDGNEDFAIIVINKSRGNTKLAVAIFNGPFGGNQNATPAFYSEKVSGGDWLFWATGDRFGNRLLVGPPSSDASYAIRPRGRTYVVQ
jgi:hypothetical protein